MLLDAAIVTLIVGLVIGRGRFVRLKELDLRAPALFVLAATLKIVLAVAGARGVRQAIQVGPPANIVAYLLVLLGLWTNRHLWAMRVVCVGVLLNFLAIFANGGSMPVDRSLAVRSGNAGLVRLLDHPSYVGHKPVTERTKLRPLADVLLLPMLFPRPGWWSPGSIGDIFITVGTCWLILGATGAFGLRTTVAKRPLVGQELNSCPTVPSGDDAP